MSPDFHADQIDATESTLESVLAKVAELTASIEKFDSTILEEREKYVKTIDELKAKRAEVRNALTSTKADLAALEKKAIADKAAAQRADELKLLQERIDTLSTELDELTNSLKWREFAYDHQIYAAKRIAFTHGFLLADNMGLGKTLSSIIALDMIAAKTKDASLDNPVESGFPGDGLPLTTRPCGRKVLYLTPKSLLNNVKKEFSEWAPDRHVYPFVDGVTNKATRNVLLGTILPKHEEFTVIINHESWRRDRELLLHLTNLNFDTIIIDEMHRLKTVDSDAFSTVMQLIDNSAIPFRIMMTGTPILNKPDDIWTALRIIAPRHFWNRSDFLYAYCDQRYVYSQSSGSSRLVWAFRPGGEERLIKAIESRILKRNLKDVGIDLPPVHTVEHNLTPDTEKYPEQYRAYVEMKRYGAALAADGTAVQASVIIAMLTRLRQLLHWPAGIVIKDPVTLKPLFNFDIQESQKLDYLIHPADVEDSKLQYEGLIPETVRHATNPDGQRTVMFSQFTGVLDEMHRRLIQAGYKVAMITGDTSLPLRDRYSLDFDRRHLAENNERGRYDVILCQYRAGGVGLNLTDATQLIAIDSEWGPKQRDQAYARIHRIGQDSPVTIHELHVEGTVDAWMQGIVSIKTDMLDGFETELNVSSAFLEAVENGLV